MFGRARAPGTCGELVQGQFKTGVDFLVTFPVDIWSDVRVEIQPASRVIEVFPIDRVKTRLAVRHTLDMLSYTRIGARVQISSDIPVGKGMASSTADIVAACNATAMALHQSLSPDQISAIARQVEPSDGIMYPGIVCYNHGACELIESLGTAPEIEILVVDLGGVVDTQQFNRIPKAYTLVELDEIERAYDLVAKGVEQGNLDLIGRAATASARVNQRILRKSALDDLIRIASAHDAFGLNVAHSGTVVGLLFAKNNGVAVSQAEHEIRGSITPQPTLFRTRSIDSWAQSEDRCRFWVGRNAVNQGDCSAPLTQ